MRWTAPFQSTPPPRGGRRFGRVSTAKFRYFNPRPPRGGRLQTAQLITQPALFQSTPPPREGGDGRPIQWSDAKRSISIHAPCEGGDLPAAIHVILQTRFQSTPPARGATVYHVISIRVVVISIHAPREGGDGQNGGGGLMAANFNPRPPRGGRRLLYWYDLCLS